MIKRMKTLGQHIVAERKKQSKTLRKLAAEVNVSPALLSLIERDKHQSSKEVVVRLAMALNSDADRWCALIGKITPDAENQLAKLAENDPVFFRNMVSRLGS